MVSDARAASGMERSPARGCDSGSTITIGSSTNGSIESPSISTTGGRMNATSISRLRREAINRAVLLCSGEMTTSGLHAIATNNDNHLLVYISRASKPEMDAPHRAARVALYGGLGL